MIITNTITIYIIFSCFSFFLTKSLPSYSFCSVLVFSVYSQRAFFHLDDTYIIIVDWLMLSHQSTTSWVSWSLALWCACVYCGPCNSADYFSSETLTDADFGTKSGSRGTELKGKIFWFGSGFLTLFAIQLG